MLKRVYLDNYYSHVAAEVRLRPLTLLLGSNGSGKSALLDALLSLSAFARGELASQTFEAWTLTRWDKRNVQTFEVELDTQGGTSYVYRVEIEFETEDEVKVQLERLTASSKLVFEYSGGVVNIPPHGPLDMPGNKRSVLDLNLAVIESEVEPFRGVLSALLLARLEPQSMGSWVKRSKNSVDVGFGNFAAWYRTLALSDPSAQMDLFSDLQDAIPGFRHLRFDQDNRGRGTLQAEFKEGKTTYRLDFDELSDGQRTLICLYTLVHFAMRPGHIIAIDEPANYVSLSELEPFLERVLEKSTGAAGPQVILASHHPQMIDTLAPSRGLLLYRDRAGPTRVKEWSEVPPSPLSASEVLRRGWESVTE